MKIALIKENLQEKTPLQDISIHNEETYQIKNLEISPNFQR